MGKQVANAGDRASALAALRPVWWKRDKKRPPGVFDATSAALGQTLGGQKGALWNEIASEAIIAGYPRARQRDRQRKYRSSAAAVTLLVFRTLWYATDICSGRVQRPARERRGHWQRHTYYDLAGLTFEGRQDRAKTEQVARHINVLIGLGWMKPPKDVRHLCEDGSVRSEPMIRELDPDLICRKAGTYGLLLRDRAYASRKAQERITAERRAAGPADAAKRPQGQVGETSSAPPAAEAPASTTDPPVRNAGQGYFDRLAKDLDKRFPSRR